MTTRIVIESSIGANGNGYNTRWHWVITPDTHIWDDTGTWFDTRIWNEGPAPELPQDLPYYL